YRDCVHIRASADGRAFGMWCTSHTPTGLCALLLGGGEAQSSYEHTSVGHVVPDATGRAFCTAAGLFTPQGKPAAGTPRFLLPAPEGDYCLRLRPGPQARPVTVYRAGQARPLAELDNVGVTVGTEQWYTHDFTDDKRVHFYPATHLLVTVPAAKDR